MSLPENPLDCTWPPATAVGPIAVPSWGKLYPSSQRGYWKQRQLFLVKQTLPLPPKTLWGDCFLGQEGAGVEKAISNYFGGMFKLEKDVVSKVCKV